MLALFEFSAGQKKGSLSAPGLREAVCVRPPIESPYAAAVSPSLLVSGSGSGVGSGIGP